MARCPFIGDLHLRPVREEDLATLHAHQDDPEAAARAAVPTRALPEFLAHWRRILADPAVVARAVEWNGVLTGNVVSWEAGGRRLVGYWIARRFWNRGIASGALRQFVEAVPQRPLWAHVARTNVPSIRVLAKAGFVPAPNEGDSVEQVMVLR